MTTKPRVYIPPNGFVGQGTQTAANQLVGARGSRTGTGRRRRKAAKKRAAPTRRRRAAKKRAGRAGRMVKGSAAAKRYMAKLRRMRRK